MKDKLESRISQLENERQQLISQHVNALNIYSAVMNELKKFIDDMEIVTSNAINDVIPPIESPVSAPVEAPVDTPSSFPVENISNIISPISEMVTG